MLPSVDGRGREVLPPGSWVDGRYELVRPLGAGAMGRVLEARDADGRRFALKVLTAAAKDRGEKDEARVRFLREAAVCATVHHPNVVPVVDHGIDAATGIPFLAMPLLEGEDLASLLERVGRLEPTAAIPLIVQACEGLQAVHEAGVVHRDVKPSNLFLASAGGCVVVKVTDFGLAKPTAAGPALAGVALTGTGRFMGTPHYISPEQAVSAKHVDVRSDVFSLGMSFYHALAGAPAFAYVRSFMGLVLEITAREAPALQDAAPWVPPPLARIVHATLLRDPNARCPSMTELALALDTATGLEVSRAPLRKDSLTSPSESTLRVVAPRAELASSWDDVLRS
jgi:serine/threonine-protein kinase